MAVQSGYDGLITVPLTLVPPPGATAPTRNALWYLTTWRREPAADQVMRGARKRNPFDADLRRSRVTTREAGRSPGLSFPPY
jgi:hypothetical protein